MGECKEMPKFQDLIVTFPIYNVGELPKF
jgi:hypothetical protein